MVTEKIVRPDGMGQREIDQGVRKMEEKNREITGITVRYSDGSTKELQNGCCVDLEKGRDDLSVEMLNVKPYDLVRLAYGLVVTVQRLGMREELENIAGGTGEEQENEE